MSGHLFSRFVGRVAGLPASSLEELHARATLAAHDAAMELDQELEDLRERLATALHASIRGLEDRKLRRALLHLKRDVHNRRPLRLERFEDLGADLEPDLGAKLRLYRELQHRRQALSEELHDVFDREAAEIRRQFQTLVDAEDFKNGLVLSSRSLAGELRRYLQAPAERPSSKIRQVERSLMRYFSRAAMKATPFSTFCALVPGTFGSNGASAFKGDPFRKRGLPRINKGIYARILVHLLQRPMVRRSFQVELNPTLRDESDGRWLFLSAVGGHEVFQRLPRNEILEELRQQLERTPLPLRELIVALVAHPEIEADEDEAAGYLDRLLEIGFLRFRIGIREQEVNWDRPLASILAHLDDEHAGALHGFLGTLRAGIDDYAGASPELRRAILDRARAELEDLDKRLGTDLLPMGQPIIYEDAGGEAEMHLEIGGDLEDVLVEYVGFTSRLAWPRNEQAGMRHFFDTHYGSEHGGVPLLRFYEDFFREHFKEHITREHEKSSQAAGHAEDSQESYDLDNPFGLDVVRRIDAGHRAFTERLQELWRAAPEAEEICLERDDLEEVLAAVPETGDTCRSASLFVQWVPGSGNGEKSALVAKSSLAGYGKYFSRFLAVLPDELRRDLIENNRRLTDQELAEICGDSAFNANLHPPLLPREISYPTGESGTADEQIPSSRIEVERDPHDPHRLRLRCARTGAGIVPVDLGFLNPRRRPPLFRLLSRFTPPANFNPVIPASPNTPPDDAASDPLQYRPRITYRGRLILARRQWQIPLAAFPARGKKESEADYFLRLRRWHAGKGLPEEVFLRVQPLQMGSEVRRLREHLYKPQYIDFRNPLLVDLFSRAAENLENALFTFEERLPRSDQLLTAGGERCVTELVVQVDFPQTKGDGNDA